VDFFPTSYLYDPTGEIVMFIPGQIRVPRVLAFMEGWKAEKSGARGPGFAARLDPLAAFLNQHYPERGPKAFEDWKRLLDGAANASPAQKLARVNDFFNKRIQVDDDQRIWGRPDYWATPGEVLGKGRGDSEDFALAKYFTLLALNIPPEQLRLVYVKLRGEAKAGADPVHMVLAHYDAPGKPPSVLDQRNPQLLSAAQRPDLQPVYSFNSLGVWDETASAASAGDPRRLAVWEDTLRRAREQGFE
jgi:predicted transglutaminase-like cysteine proteinase